MMKKGNSEIFEKENRFTAFYAVQSILLFFLTVMISILLAMAFIGLFVIPVWFLLIFIFWFIALIRAYWGRSGRFLSSGTSLKKSTS